MRVSLLNLMSTTIPVLNSLGLRLRVGLSSEDPMVGRNATEAYDAFFSVYSPEGLLIDRIHVGQIPPSRRRFFDVNDTVQHLVYSVDHLVVAHRIPSRMLASGVKVEDELDMTVQPDYSLFRSLVEYSFAEGGNGSVIYETPFGLNTSSVEG